MRCSIFECAGQLETVLFGLGLCGRHVALAEGIPGEHWSDMSPARLFRWLGDCDETLHVRPGFALGDVAAEVQRVRVLATERGSTFSDALTA